MSPRNGLSGRLRSAMQVYAARHGGRVSPPTFGEAVATAQGLPVAYSPATVTSWMDGMTVPSFDVLMAIAAVAGYTSGPQKKWIAYGHESHPEPLDERTYSRYYGLS